MICSHLLEILALLALVNAKEPCAGGYLEKCVAECSNKNYTACAGNCVQTCATPASRKRGFSGFLGSTFTCDDARALNLGDSWYYNWIGNPTQYNKCKVGKGANRTAAEFVPMVNGLGVARSMMDSHHYVQEWAYANVRYLLGFNEPDYGNGHNHPHMCSPADAAKEWVNVQAVAGQFDPPLTLVGPAISSSGPDAWDADGASQWLDYFFGNCSVVPGCNSSSIKYIAMHDYHGNLTGLKRRIEGAFKRYGGRKIWLTEVAITNWGQPPSRSEQDAYMSELLPYLDSSEHVFRYAWFSSRNSPNPQNGGSNLLPSDSDSMTPTSTGKIYAAKTNTVMV